MITKNHLRSVISLARQSKEDLKMISDDGGEVFAYKLVVSIFSTSMANLFLNQDEVMTTVMVPASCKTLQNILKIILGIGPGGLRAPCVRHACLRAPCVAWPLLSPSLSLSSSSSFFFFPPSFAFDPLRGNSHVRNNFSPNILA